MSSGFQFGELEVQGVEPVFLIRIYCDTHILLKTPFDYCFLLGILVGCYLVPCLYSICFSRVFILRHFRILKALDLLLSNIAIFFTFSWLDGFTFFSPPIPALLIISFMGTSAIWGLFGVCYLAWVKGKAGIETYLAPFIVLFMTFWFCTQSEYLAFSDFLGILRDKLSYFIH